MPADRAQVAVGDEGAAPGMPPGPQAPAAGPTPAQPSTVPAAAGPVPADTAPATVAFPALQSCLNESGRTTLYIQIFDEESRAPAADLRQALLAGASSPVMVAPIENVIRSADLRQKRRPVPWPRPTLILHNASLRDCARAISHYIGFPWIVPGDNNGARLRDLPPSLQAQPGVIELWLPPLTLTASDPAANRQN
jgi:hypothetical protein